jgi:hypothetical protein
VLVAASSSGGIEWTADQWSAVGACATAAVAVIAACVAYFQVREAKKLRLDQAKPYVVVDIQPSRVSVHLLNLIVENTGATMARNVTFDFNPPLESSLQGYEIADSTFARSGLPMIPPRRRHEYLFDSSVGRLNSDLPMKFDVTVRYEDREGKRQEPLKFPIDLSPLYGLRVVQERGLHDIARAVEQIAKTTTEWSHRGGLRAWTRNEDAYNDAERAERALTGEYPHLGKASPPEVLIWLMRFPPLRSLVGTALDRWRKRKSC